MLLLFWYRRGGLLSSSSPLSDALTSAVSLDAIDRRVDHQAEESAVRSIVYTTG